MASRQFHLLGEDPSRTKEIEVEASLDFEELQHLASSHFAIVDASGK